MAEHASIKGASQDLAATYKKSSSWRDYLTLTKPNVVLLLLLTALVGMALATPTWVAWQVLVPALVGIGLMSASAAAVNHLVDRHIDARMARTLRRPLPSGALSPKRVLTFAAVIGVLGFVVLAVWVNMLTAWLTLASLVGYAFIYTMYLKRATPQNIVIGGLAGAAPPLLGWTAVTNEIHPFAILLVMIVFTWTPPHFWALAVHRAKDYAKAEIPMLPVTHGIEFTKTCILLYTILLGVVCLLPYLVGMSGVIYLIGSTVLSLWFLVYAWKLKFAPQQHTAFSMFKFSIWHLMILFVLLLVDHYLVLPPMSSF
ncbi:MULTISPECIES: heme o synthase [Idiomarinaceae]|uniref:Protoheme IX farnesyltransferase n=2 Tax=Pseudidiomarina TaxID=2800384 RepID=A0A368UQF2_9GAMM|nr:MULTISPECIES: heme o synthase [Idiomarinaceae]MDX1526304.1 heme o synthase [Pseudidiomarina maritima]MRJ42820.1 protoheme IX farnesyltransferase [Idiomarina sp. FeN1]NCU58372.1 protoheme IX farnesyltransferase [Idiomarina sp. FenA--70]NCU61070.1 protoheme IX farnesyltransferase [Idiomarina sp. FenBw--71]PWW09791.1 protoheme IX farnesyltransferase [Pseudidiomarina maritima]